MFSSAVSVGSRLKNWKTKPMLWRRTSVASLSFRTERRLPARVTSPAEGRSSPPRRWSRVDLPLPEGPMMATNSPLATWKSRPASASTAHGAHLVLVCADPLLRVRFWPRSPSSVTVWARGGVRCQPAALSLRRARRRKLVRRNGRGNGPACYPWPCRRPLLPGCSARLPSDTGKNCLSSGIMLPQ